MKARKINKTVNDVKTERNAQGVELINYANSARVFMEWGWSEDATKDQMVRLTMRKNGEKMSAIIYAEEFLRFLRWA